MVTRYRGSEIDAGNAWQRDGNAKRTASRISLSLFSNIGVACAVHVPPFLFFLFLLF
jgi:hypothetical protein